jgi:uncharacterized protein YjbJ (UPF0337 family)
MLTIAVCPLAAKAAAEIAEMYVKAKWGKLTDDDLTAINGLDI